MPPAPTRAPRKTALQQKTGLYLHSYSAYIKGKTVMEINWDQVYMRCKLLWVVLDLRLWIVQAAHFCSSPWNSQLFSKAQRKHDMGRGGGVKGTNSSFALYSSRSKTSINSLSYYMKIKNTFFFSPREKSLPVKNQYVDSFNKSPVWNTTPENSNLQLGHRHSLPCTPEVILTSSPLLTASEETEKLLQCLSLSPYTRAGRSGYAGRRPRHPSGISLQQAKQAGDSDSPPAGDLPAHHKAPSRWRRDFHSLL